MFRIDHASKKSNAISVCDSKSVLNATRPRSTASRPSHSASSFSRSFSLFFPFFPFLPVSLAGGGGGGLLTRESAQRCMNGSIAWMHCRMASAAVLMMSSSSICGEKPSSSGTSVGCKTACPPRGAACFCLSVMVVVLLEECRGDQRTANPSLFRAGPA